MTSPTPSLPDMDVDIPHASDPIPHASDSIPTSSATRKRRQTVEVVITTRPTARRKQVATKELPRKHRAAKLKAIKANAALAPRTRVKASRPRVKASRPTSTPAVLPTGVVTSHTVPRSGTSLLGVKGPKGPKGPSMSQAPPRRIVSSLLSL